jgi:hypothetical protein
VAGAVSGQPGIKLGEPGEDKVLVAQSGRVRVKADARYGAIRPGDLLVSSSTRVTRCAREALLTVDQSLEFQQNVRASGIGVVVVLAKTNRVKELRPLVGEILGALARLTPGEVIHIGR